MTEAVPDAGGEASGKGTRRLLLLRHAKATGMGVAGGAAPANGSDHGRDLDERGERNVAALGREMDRLGLRPDLVLVSSALRTRRSWELLGLAGSAPQVRLMDRLYLAEDSELLDAIREVPDAFPTVLLIGHNPGLHTLAMDLAGTNAPPGLRNGLPTCTLVDFTLDGRWADLGPEAVHTVRMLGP